MEGSKKLLNNLVLNLLLVFILPVVLITVGFSALSTSLSVNGIAMFEPVGMIVVMSNEPADETLNNNISYSHTHDTITISANLENVSDVVTYNVSIRNLGQTNKVLSEIIEEELSNSQVKFTLNGLAIGDMFLPGQSIDFTVTFRYKNGVTNPSETTVNSILRFVFDDYEVPPVLNGYFMPYDGENNLFGYDKTNITGFKRNTTLTLDEVLAISGVTKISNESNDQYNSLVDVYGWVDSNNVFNWWSTAELVYFHPNTLHAFKYFSNIIEVDLTGTSTEKVENFAHWFDKDRNLQRIIGKINTSGLKLQYNDSFDYLNDQVDDATSGYGVAFLFNDCNKLEQVDLSQIDTTNASDMKRMFAGCQKLTEIDVSRFNTSNARSMHWLFRKCSTLQEVDLRGFDTSNVVNMYGMFTQCPQIQRIYFGDNWDTSHVKNFNYMFNGASKLTTIYAKHDFTFMSGALQNNMFSNDTKLVGAAGTSYATNYTSSKVNGAYAKIATPEQNGYFTFDDTDDRFTITYTLDGGTATNPASYYTTTPTFTLEAPLKEGYTFTGWTGSNGNTPELNVTIVQGTIGNKHYEAHYTVNTYIIQYAANGGVGSMSFQDCVYNQNVVIATNTFTYEHHRFTGWNTAADGSGLSLTEGQSTSNLVSSGTITLYAQWLDLATLFPEVFKLSGPCTLNGQGVNITGDSCTGYTNTDYINTGIQLFNAENKSKDFMISMDILHYSPSEQNADQASLINSKLENASLNYPGFVFRRAPNSLEITARFNNDKKTYNINNNISNIRIARKDGKIYYSVNGGAFTLLIDANKYSGTFTTPVTFGSSLDANGVRMRVMKNTTIANMSIKLGTMETLQ